MISAEVVCDSISDMRRITTMRLRYPKFIHGEFMTHRVFSRNASSSRAIPVKKMIEEVRDDALRAAPVFWGKNQKGMQADEELSDVRPDRTGFNAVFSDKERAQLYWKYAANHAADLAECMERLGAHKQIANRILEPFSHINVVVTATEWDNFFGLRLAKNAQPEMRSLAECMWVAFNESRPQSTAVGAWHLPFCTLEGDAGAVRDIDQPAVRAYAKEHFVPVVDVARCVSVARCARVSYQSYETGKRSTVAEDLQLHAQLRQSGHWSPFEHQATPDGDAVLTQLDVIDRTPGRPYQFWTSPNKEAWGNLVGWIQFRKMIPGESVAQLPEEHRHGPA